MNTKIVKFEEIAECFEMHGSPEMIFINKKDSRLLRQALPAFYNENLCNQVFVTGHLGYLKEVPVLPGSIGSRRAKLCWN